MVFVVGVGQYYVFFQSVKLDVKDAVPAWIFPIYPLLVVGTMAGTIIPAQPVERGWYMCEFCILCVGGRVECVVC